MRKFPVISEKGIEYLVKISNPLFDYYAVKVCVKRKIFGVTYNSQVNYEDLGGSPWYDGFKYDYNFVKMATDEIARIEAKWAEESRREKMREIGTNKFADWDGKC